MNSKGLIAAMGTLAGGALTFIVMYLTLVGTYAPKEEIRRMIEKESPYVQDAKWISESIRTFGTKMDRLSEQMDEVLRRLPD